MMTGISFLSQHNEYKLVSNPAENKFNQRVSNQKENKNFTLKVLCNIFFFFFSRKFSLCVSLGICWNAFKRWNWRQNQNQHSTDIKRKWFIGRRVNCLEIMETYRIHIFPFLPQFVFCILRVENFIGYCKTKHGSRSSLSHPDTIILKDFLIYVHFSFNDWTKFIFSCSLHSRTLQCNLNLGAVFFKEGKYTRLN